jgi:hypothetical protein
MALILDMVRADPERRPSQEMLRWHHELAELVGIEPAPVRNNRELLDGALRIDRILRAEEVESETASAAHLAQAAGTG